MQQDGSFEAVWAV